MHLLIPSGVTTFPWINRELSPADISQVPLRTGARVRGQANLDFCLSNKKTGPVMESAGVV